MPQCSVLEREFFNDNLLARNHFFIEMMRWTGLASWEVDLPFSALFLTFAGPVGDFLHSH